MVKTIALKRALKRLNSLHTIVKLYLINYIALILFNKKQRKKKTKQILRKFHNSPWKKKFDKYVKTENITTATITTVTIYKYNLM